MAKPNSAKGALVLRLYVAGSGPSSVRAIANVNAVCGEHFPSGHELEIVDVLRFPLRGLADAVVVTPMLIRLSPRPMRRIVGTLGDAAQLLSTLGGAF